MLKSEVCERFHTQRKTLIYLIIYLIRILKKAYEMIEIKNTITYEEY